MAHFNHVALTYNQTGQTLEFFPPMTEVLVNGAPTAAATYKVYGGLQSNDDTEKFSGTATLDAASTTFDAASGVSQANRQKLNLASTASVVIGRRYLIQNAAGQREIVIPYQIVSNDYILVEEPLCYDYAASDTLVGLRHYFTVDAMFIQDQSNLNAAGANPLLNAAAADGFTKIPPFRIRWAYTTGSVGQITWTTFDVVRQPAKTNIQIDDLRGILPDVIYQEWISQRGQDFMPQLEVAMRDMRIEARAAGYDPDAVRDPEIWDHLVRRKWIVIIGEALLYSGADNIQPWLERATAEFTRMFEKTIGTTLRAWIDTTSTGGVTVSPPRQLWLGGR